MEGFGGRGPTYKILKKESQIIRKEFATFKLGKNNEQLHNSAHTHPNHSFLREIRCQGLEKALKRAPGPVNGKKIKKCRFILGAGVSYRS